MCVDPLREVGGVLKLRAELLQVQGGGIVTEDHAVGVAHAGAGDVVGAVLRQPLGLSWGLAFSLSDKLCTPLPLPS